MELTETEALSDLAAEAAAETPGSTLLALVVEAARGTLAWEPTNLLASASL